MRKLLLTTAAVAAAIGLAGCGSGTLTDKRDGQKYRTVVINGKRWMAQNLNYKTKGGSWCYNDSVSYCKKYGRLYDWNTAKTVCPNGYHLPSRVEWDNLAHAIGDVRMQDTTVYLDNKLDYRLDYWYDVGKKFKAKSGWNNFMGNNGNGTDDFGFLALPSGFRDPNGEFSNIGENGAWWAITVDGYSGNVGIVKGSDNMFALYYMSDGLILSVRCVADRP